MTYLTPHNRHERNKSRAIVSTLVAVGAIVALIQLFIPHFLPAFFTSVARPFWRAEFAIESGSLRSSDSLLAENEELKRELLELQVQSKSTAGLVSENNELKGLLGRKGPELIATSSITVSTSTDASTSTASTDTTATTDIKKTIKPPFKVGTRTLAAVLRHPPLMTYDELIIDGGEDLGFKVGDKVYATTDLVIGTVSDVLGEISKVALLSSPGERYEVTIGSSHASAYAIGRGGGQYSADLPRIVSVNVGDEVHTAALNDKPFGIVERVISDPAQPFETVLFAPPVNVFGLRWVLVETASSTPDKTSSKGDKNK